MRSSALIYQNNHVSEKENSDVNEKIPAEKYAYDTIKRRILNLELRPGEYINDMDIAVELNISRTPVRDAFRRLEYEGLLNAQMRKGWQVSPLSLEDIREIFEIKKVLQGLLSENAARCKDISLREKLKDEIERMKTSNETGNQKEWEKAHHEFHQTLLEMTGKPDGRTSRIVSNLNDQWRRIRIGLYSIEGYRQRESMDHIAIGNAILENDPEKASQLTQEHLERVKNEILSLLSKLVFPFAPNGI